MITAIKAENIGAYKALFEEATDILSGYKRVRTYDAEVTEYYYKEAKATEEMENTIKVMSKIASVFLRAVFITALPFQVYFFSSLA